MALLIKSALAVAFLAGLGGLPSSASAMAPAPASPESDAQAAREAFVEALPLDDAIMGNWLTLGWPLFDQLMREPGWAPPPGMSRDIFASGFLIVLNRDMERLIPSILPQVRAEVVHDWRDLQTVEDWQRDTAFAKTPAGRNMFIMILSDSPLVIAAARRAIYPRVTADRDQLYGRVVDQARRYQQQGLPPMVRPERAELE